MHLLRIATPAMLLVLASCSDPQCHPDEVKVGTSCQKIHRTENEQDSDSDRSTDSEDDDSSGTVGSRDADGADSTGDDEVQSGDSARESGASGEPTQSLAVDASAAADDSTKPDATGKPQTRDSGTPAAPSPNECTTKRGTRCWAGSGDCQGTGLWECDPGNPSSLRCTAVERPKNACGVTCGALSEDCSTPGDDNCNGQANEGCCAPTAELCDGKDNDCDSKVDEDGVCVCGDGIVSASEACDPKAPGSSPWSCSRTCERQTIYRFCERDSDCTASKGEKCGMYKVCTQPCTAYGISGAASGCPDAPPGLVSFCYGVTPSGGGAPTSGMCMVNGCSTKEDCDTNLSCYVNLLFQSCVGA